MSTLDLESESELAGLLLRRRGLARKLQSKSVQFERLGMHSAKKLRRLQDEIASLDETIREKAAVRPAA